MINLGIISLEHPHSTGNHIPALRYIQDKVKVAAIAHPDIHEAQPFVDLFGARYYNNRDDLLNDQEIDAVLVTSRNSCHSEDSIASAEAGKDIFCDKPISTVLEDAAAIVDAIRNTGVRFFTTFPVRFNTSIRSLKNSIDSGRIGRIQAIMATNHGCMYEPGAPAWVMDPKQNGGGCLIDHTVHVADLIRWFTGAEFSSVQAFTENALRKELEAEDLAVMHGEMTDGTIYQIDASWSRRGRDPMWGDVTLRVVGSEGSATLDLYNNQVIEIYNEDGFSLKYPNHLCREHAEIFLDYAASKSMDYTSINADEIDGFRTLELVFAAYDSEREGKMIDIKHRKWQA